MKRLSRSDSLGAMVSVCPAASENKCLGGSQNNNKIYEKGFQPILDGLEDEDCIEESGQIAEKKRRLSANQVRELERNFEVENKLEPERKVKIAQELGLQPRQVAVWFQNRRARWKTKQLEKDYGLLKAGYDALKLDCDALNHDKEALSAEIRNLKLKLQTEVKVDAICPIKEENKALEQNKICGALKGLKKNTNHDQDHYNFGRSDSDCSTILNEENSPNVALLSEGLPQQQSMVSPLASSFRSDCDYVKSFHSHMKSLPFESSNILTNTEKDYQQFMKMNEHNTLNVDESCSFFSDEQALILPWCCPEKWN